VARRPDLAPYCEPAAGGTWSLFKVNARCSGDDGLAVAAAQIASVLKALNEAAAPPKVHNQIDEAEQAGT